MGRWCDAIHGDFVESIPVAADTVTVVAGRVGIVDADVVVGEVLAAHGRRYTAAGEHGLV